MTAIHAKAFRPAVPLTSPRLLQGNYATVALACKLQSGCLDPFKGPQLVRTSPLASIGTMYRYRASGIDYWLEWERSGVDVVRSPNSQDARQRVYWSGDGEPRMAAFSDAISGTGAYPGASYVLGVYIPQQLPTIAVAGGSTPVESRAYITTLVTQYGEEGAPSLPVVQSGNATGTWTLSNLEAPPPNAGTVTGVTVLTGGFVRVGLNTVRGLAQYESLTLAAVGGMTDLIGTHRIEAINAGGTSNTVDLRLTTSQTYTSGGTWARSAPHNTTGMRRRIYRSVGTTAIYLFVDDIDATLTSYADTKAATALGGACPTIDSFTPPKNGHSLRAMANGALSMLAGNEVCFSEIGKPHSWPIANRYSFSGIGVTQEVVGNSCIIATDSAPSIAVATTPDRAQVVKVEGCLAGCVAKLGAVDTGNGVAYPAADGLWLVTSGVPVNLTEKLFSFEQWQALKPESFRAAFVDGEYWAVHDSPGGSPKLLLLDLRGGAPDGYVEVDDAFNAIYTNPFDGRMYVSRANRTFLWDEDDTNRYLGLWRGPTNQLGPPTNFSIAQVHAEFGDIVPVDNSILTANEQRLVDYLWLDGPLGTTPVVGVPLASSGLQEQPTQTARKVQFTLLTDGRVRFSREVTSAKPFRLPGGFKSETVAVEIASSTRVYSASIAQGVDELRQVST